MGDSALEGIEQRELRRRGAPLDQTSKVDGDRPAVVGILPAEELFPNPFTDLGRHQQTGLANIKLDRSG